MLLFQPVPCQYDGDLESFENDWLEVELKFLRQESEEAAVTFPDESGRWDED